METAAAKTQDDGDSRQGQRQRRQWTSTVTEMRDNIYGGNGDTDRRKRR